MAFNFLPTFPFSRKPIITSSREVLFLGRYPGENRGLAEATKLSLVAIAALVMGVAVYFFVRGPQSVYFLHGWSGFEGLGSSTVRQFTGSLPSFVHIYSFILLTAAALAPWRAFTPAICLFWLVSESFFEIGQHSALAQALAGLSPGVFTRTTYLEAVPSFFLNGTFDPMDLVALAAGTLFAYLTIIWIRNGRCHDVR